MGGGCVVTVGNTWDLPGVVHRCCSQEKIDTRHPRVGRRLWRRTSRGEVVMAMLPFVLVPLVHLPQRPLGSISSRRAVVVGAPLAAWASGNSGAAVAAEGYSELRARLTQPIVAQSANAFTAPLPGRSEPRLPAWLAGRWQAEQTLQAYSTPLGVQYIGAAGRPLSEAEASAAETRKQIGQPVKLELRYRTASSGGAFEDRPFNALSRLDAFAGRSVVRAASTCADAGVDSAGLACTFVEFKGPVNQKQIVNSVRVALPPAGDETNSPDVAGAFVSSDSIRQIFARRKVAGDTRNFPPITTDSEVLLSLAPTGSDAATGRLRLVEYLQPNE